MREVSERQAEKEWSSINVEISEHEQISIAEEFAKQHAKIIACWLTGHNGAATVKKHYSEYLRQVISWRQERIWKERTGARYDFHRGQYLAMA